MRLFRGKKTTTLSNPEANPLASPADQLLEPATRQRAGWGLILILCSLLFGISVTEGVSNNLLPVTLRRFTEDARIIAWILAINPAFGFIAQPLVGVLSDHIWTPIGRRAFFLITGAPIVALCLVFIPFSAFLWQIVVLVVIYQFFEDVLYGSDHPLLADLVPPEQRSFVAGAMITSGQLASLFVLRLGMVWADRFGEWILYAIAAVFQIVFVSIVAFFLKEKPVVKRNRPPLSVKRYVKDLLDQPMLFRLGLVNFLKAVHSNAIGGFVVLYAVDTLGMTKGEFGGKAWYIAPLVPLCLALLVGWGVERFSKQKAMLFALGLFLACCVFGAASKGVAGLALAALFFGLSDVLLNVTHKAFLTEYMPADIIGQLSGAINIFYATGRTLSLIAVGYLVYWFGNNYTVIWYFAGAVAILNVLVMRSVRDVRFETRQASRNGAPSAA